jgi:hypothetical protein
MSKVDIIDNFKKKAKGNPFFEKFLVKLAQSSEEYLDDDLLWSTYTKIVENKTTLKNKKVNVFIFETFDELNDKLDIVINEQKNTVFTKSFLSKKYQNIANKKTYELFGKLRENNVSKEIINEQFVKSMAALKNTLALNKQLSKFVHDTLNFGAQKIQEDIQNTNSEILISEPSVLSVLIKDFNACQVLGSSRWCISRSEAQYSSYIMNNNNYVTTTAQSIIKKAGVLPEGSNHYVFVYDLLKEMSDPMHLVGYTVNDIGNIVTAFNAKNMHVGSDKYQSDVLNKSQIEYLKTQTNIQRTSGINYKKLFKQLTFAESLIVAAEFCPGEIINLVKRSKVKLNQINAVIRERAEKVNEFGLLISSMDLIKELKSCGEISIQDFLSCRFINDELFNLALAEFDFSESYPDLDVILNDTCSLLFDPNANQYGNYQYNYNHHHRNSVSKKYNSADILRDSYMLPDFIFNNFVNLMANENYPQYSIKNKFELRGVFLADNKSKLYDKGLNFNEMPHSVLIDTVSSIMDGTRHTYQVENINFFAKILVDNNISTTALKKEINKAPIIKSVFNASSNLNKEALSVITKSTWLKNMAEMFSRDMSGFIYKQTNTVNGFLTEKYNMDLFNTLLNHWKESNINRFNNKNAGNIFKMVLLTKPYEEIKELIEFFKEKNKMDILNEPEVLNHNKIIGKYIGEEDIYTLLNKNKINITPNIYQLKYLMATEESVFEDVLKNMKKSPTYKDSTNTLYNSIVKEVKESGQDKWMTIIGNAFEVDQMEPYERFSDMLSNPDKYSKEEFLHYIECNHKELRDYMSKSDNSFVKIISQYI